MSQVIFGRDTGIFFCYDAIFDREDLNTHEKLIYTYFCRRANKTGESFPSINTIAKECSCGRTKAKQSINRLHELGLVVKQRRRLENGKDTSNLYVIYPPTEPYNGKEEKSCGSPHDQGGVATRPEGGRHTTTRRGRHTTTHIKDIYNYKDKREIIKNLYAG